ncbi:MAG: 2-oxoacid:acceptor oxidoreductase family protein [Thiohalospira sp.]
MTAASLASPVEVRIHGRGGQGNVAAAYMLAATAIREGAFGQAFPAFGAERRGAPVAAFVRIADHRLRRRSQIRQPAFLIVQDAALLGVPGTLAGLRPGGAVLVNSDADDGDLARRLGAPAVALPAGALAREILGRPVPNTALLAAFLALTGLLGNDALKEEVTDRFAPKGEEVVRRNHDLIDRAAAAVPAGAWEEAVHAATA